jgi:hypothetical protein
MERITEAYKKMIDSHTNIIERLNHRLNKPSSFKQLEMAKSIILREKARLYLPDRLKYPADIAKFIEDDFDVLHKRYADLINRIDDAIKKNELEQDNKKEKSTNELLPNKADNPKRTINKEELGKYFKPTFKGQGQNLNQFETMIEELKTDREAKKFAQIAFMIYESKQMNDRKPNTFAAWYKIFCENIGVEQGKGYKPNNLKNPGEALKRLFNYL